MPTPGRTSPLGEYIRRTRQLQDITGREFARMAGISNPYLSQIERGLREPSDRVVESIAKSFEMTADALYERAGVPTENPEGEGGTRAAIAYDEALTARQRRALLELYDACLAANGAGARRRRRT